MAGVRDPAFWKRFSMAVHLDEENGSQGQADLKHRYLPPFSYTTFPNNHVGQADMLIWK